jgi:hypothetical protein
MEYPESLRVLIPEEREMELAAGPPRAEMRAALARFDLAAMMAPCAIADTSLAAGCHAGLWLAHNFLEESHRVSQEIDTPTGSFWHAIMHRREGDYDNACYWFRRVREHAVYEPLLKLARSASEGVDDPALVRLIRGQRWDPFVFVKLVRSVVTGDVGDATEQACRRIARREWQLLFEFCYRGALGMRA